MRNAALISAGLHAAAITLTVVGVPVLFDSKPVEVVPIAVELVVLEEAEKPAPDPKPKPEPEPRREPPEPPPPEPEAAAPPPPAPTPEPVAEFVPAPTPPEPAPKPVVKTKPKPKPKPKLKLLARSVDVPQPRRKPRAPPDEFQKLLKNLEIEKKREEKKREDDERRDKEAADRGPQGQARASTSRRCSSAEPHRQGVRTAPQSWTSYGTGTPSWHSRQRPDPPKQAKTSADWGGHWGQR